MRRLVLIAALVAVTAPTGGAAAPASAPALLTYVARDGGICVVRADGTHAVRLTAKATKVAAPAWAPHGRYLAFDRVGPTGPRHATVQVVVADARGRVVARLGSGDETTGPLWAPDGRHLAYFLRAGPTAGFAIARPDGSGQRVVAGCRHVPSEACPADPTWSADGQRIAFADGDTTESVGIWSVRFDGGDRRRIVARGRDPAFAPATARLAYVAPNGPGTSLFVSDADGHNAHAVTPAGRYGVFAPVWSPDERTIAFLRAPCQPACTPTEDLVVANVDGSGARIVAGNLSSGRVAWSPDGRLIAFTRGRGILVVRSDGAGQRGVVRRGGYRASGVTASWRAATPLPPAKRAPCPLG